MMLFIQGWLNLGNKQRATAATGMNDKSSRSHSVFTLVLTQTQVQTLKRLRKSFQRHNYPSGVFVQLNIFLYFVCSFKQTEFVEGEEHEHSITSRINLVDLAGSERSNSAQTSGDQLRVHTSNHVIELLFGPACFVFLSLSMCFYRRVPVSTNLCSP